MKLVLKILLPLVIITAAIFGAKKLVESKKKPEKREIEEVIPSVSVKKIKPQTHRPEVRSFGTIQSYDEAKITAEISAKIVWISDNFRVGNKVSKGDILLKLEKRDFETALEQQKANLVEITRQLSEEQVRAQQAADDWIASGRKLETATAFRLRKPQLEALNAQLEAAEASITKAELDLTRAEIAAPFDALVISRSANLGELANSQSNLGTLSFTEKAELRLPLSSEQFAQVDASLTQENIATTPLTVTLTTPTHEGERQALIVRLDPTIDARNQVQYLIAEVTQPYAAEPFPLPIGTFVNASLKGKPLAKTYRFPESAMVEDSYVWIVGKDMTLERFPVKRLAVQDGKVIARAKSEYTESIAIVSQPLTTFRPGMKIQLNDSGKSLESNKSAPKKSQNSDS